ncbi:MAG TPA: TetR/AcrR family transcriptional regulator [Pseudonocardiaceae bacterium]
MLLTAPERHDVRPAQRGRPRDASRDEVLRRATLEVMAEVGYRALTMDAVAARARAGKATIYRRWESKLELVIDVTNHLAKSELPDPDTGSTTRDLREFLYSYADFLTGVAGRAAQTLVGELPHEPELAKAFRTAFLLSQQTILERILERGRQRGEVRPDVPVCLVAELAGGALLHRLMLSAKPLDRGFVDHLVDQVLLPVLT